MITEDNQAEQSAQLLSQANLHRMRQEWDEAVTSCMQVLYSDPDNWRAHALLGDIYADQKRPDEAIRWYCMTLDIRPDSHSTRDKLNHVVTSRRQEFVESLDPTRTLVDRTGKFYKNDLLGKFSWQWSAPERRKRLLPASAVALLILIAVAVPALTGKNQPGQKPVFAPGTPTASTLFLQPVPDSKTSPASSSSTGSTNNLASGINQSTASSGNTDNSAASTSNLHDSNEASLIAGLSTDQDLTNAGIHVTDAEIDPPTNTVSVTYACDTASQPLTPDRILRAGLIVGKEALNRPEGTSAQTCVVRCLTVASANVADAASMASGASSGSSNAQSPSLVFLATLPRSAVNNTPSIDKITDFQISQTFSTIWWAQGSQASQPQSANSVTTPSPTP